MMKEIRRKTISGFVVLLALGFFFYLTMGLMESSFAQTKPAEVKVKPAETKPAEKPKPAVAKPKPKVPTEIDRRFGNRCPYHGYTRCIGCPNFYHSRPYGGVVFSNSLRKARLCRGWLRNGRFQPMLQNLR